MNKIKFQKSDILKLLYDNQNGFIVPKLVDVFYSDLKEKNHLRLIRQNLSSKQLVIRSSSENEDGLEISVSTALVFLPLA